MAKLQTVDIWFFLLRADTKSGGTIMASFRCDVGPQVIPLTQQVVRRSLGLLRDRGAVSK